MIEIYDVNLDWQILNLKIFSKLTILKISQRLNSIQKDLFAYFPLLVSIEIDLIGFMHVAHKQGIEWINSLNPNLDFGECNFGLNSPKR